MLLRDAVPVRIGRQHFQLYAIGVLCRIERLRPSPTVRCGSASPSQPCHTTAATAHATTAAPALPLRTKLAAISIKMLPVAAAAARCRCSTGRLRSGSAAGSCTAHLAAWWAGRQRGDEGNMSACLNAWVRAPRGCVMHVVISSV